MNSKHQGASDRLKELKDKGGELVESEVTLPPAQGFDWMSNPVVAFVTGGLCTFLITQLAKEFLASLGTARRILAIVFLLLIFVPLSVVIQWFVAQRVPTKDGASTEQ